MRLNRPMIMATNYTVAELDAEQEKVALDAGRVLIKGFGRGGAVYEEDRRIELTLTRDEFDAFHTLLDGLKTLDDAIRIRRNSDRSQPGGNSLN
jgi:hypothetical protein